MCYFLGITDFVEVSRHGVRVNMPMTTLNSFFSSGLVSPIMYLVECLTQPFLICRTSSVFFQVKWQPSFFPIQTISPKLTFLITHQRHPSFPITLRPKVSLLVISALLSPIIGFRFMYPTHAQLASLSSWITCSISSTKRSNWPWLNTFWTTLTTAEMISLT